MEDALDRWTRRASDSSRRIRSVRITRWKRLILRKRPDRSWIVAHSNERWRRGRGNKLAGSYLLGLLGGNRERHLLPRHNYETWNCFLGLYYPARHASVRCGPS